MLTVKYNFEGGTSEAQVCYVGHSNTSLVVWYYVIEPTICHGNFYSYLKFRKYVSMYSKELNSNITFLCSPNNRAQLNINQQC